MAQSLAAIYVHLVFSTRDRHPFLAEKSIRQDMHSYLAGISNNLDSPALIVGGVADHVHILSRLGRTISLTDWVKEIKGSSSKWVKQEGRRDFAWQGGYGAFSISADGIESVKRYIASQEEYHHKFSFQDELRSLFRNAGIEWDEQHLWS